MICSPQGILPCSLKGCNSIAQDEILDSGKSQINELMGKGQAIHYFFGAASTRKPIVS
jgi:hypothetical protein